MTLDEQKAVLRKHARNSIITAIEDLRHALNDPHEHLLRLAMSRLEAGYTTFGDEITKKTPKALYQEGDEELADRIVYGSFALNNGG